MPDGKHEIQVNPRVLLFDIDATLLLSGHAGTRAVNRAYERMYGIAGAMDGIRPDGKTDPLIFREIFERRLNHLALEREIPRLAEVYLDYLKEEVEHSTGFRLMEGVRELLEALSNREGFLLGLATGNFEQAAWIKLRRGGLDHYFHFGGFGSDSEDRTEVVKCAIRRAEKILGHPVRLDLVYVIGDTVRDILHAREAGARTVAVATGRTPLSELVQYRPEHVLADLSDTDQVLRIFTAG